MEQRKLLGDMLVEAGSITQEQLNLVLEQQGKTGKRIGELLVNLKLITETQLIQTLSNQTSIPWVSLYHVEFTREILNLVPSAFAERYGLIPIYVRRFRGQGETLFVAMDDPTQVNALSELSQLISKPVRPMLAAPSDVQNAIGVYYFGKKIQTPSKIEVVEQEGAAVSLQATTSPPAAPMTKPPTPPEQTPTPKRTPRATKVSKPRMITLALLDGTNVTLPAPKDQDENNQSEPTEAQGLTAKDLLGALRAHAQGVSVEEVISDVRWEPFVVSLMSLLLRKGIIADWEFVDEWKKNMHEVKKKPNS